MSERILGFKQKEEELCIYCDEGFSPKKGDVVRIAFFHKRCAKMACPPDSIGKCVSVVSLEWLEEYCKENQHNEYEEGCREGQMLVTEVSVAVDELLPATRKEASK